MPDTWSLTFERLSSPEPVFLPSWPQERCRRYRLVEDLGPDPKPRMQLPGDWTVDRLLDYVRAAGGATAKGLAVTMGGDQRALHAQLMRLCETGHLHRVTRAGDRKPVFRAL